MSLPSSLHSWGCWQVCAQADQGPDSMAGEILKQEDSLG